MPQPRDPLAASTVKPRVNKFFRSDFFNAAGINNGTRPLRRPCNSRTLCCCMSSECKEQLGRGLNFAFFCCGCMGSLAQQTMPWLLSALDAAAHLLVYALFVPKTLLVDLLAGYRYHFRFRSSMEDVLLVALVRAVAVGSASCSGVDRFQRPYLFAAIGCALVGIPFFIAKAATFRYRGDWWWLVVMMAFSLGFSFAHMLCSMRVVDLARRRYSQGTVMGFNVRAWEEGEDAWLNANVGGRPSPLADSEGGWQRAWKGDVNPEALADQDSRFLKIDHITVHYKVAEPEVTGCTNRHAGIVLVHGFGAGLFCWRHIMQPLANSTGCRVVAFDRPAFGLTSRPSAVPKNADPYSVKFQANLLLQLCSALKLQEVVVAGHADGALVALMAAAASSRDSPHANKTSEAIQGALTLRDCRIPLSGQGDDQVHDAAGGSVFSNHASDGGSSMSSCLSTFRSCAPSGSFQRPSSSAAPSLSTAVLRAARSCDHAPLLNAAENVDLELGGGNRISSNRRNELFDPMDLTADVLSSGFELVSHGVRVTALAMLHPSLEGEVKPQFMRLLSNSRVGRRIMRPLLRTEIGEIANRRAWFDADKLTKEVLDLYKRPLCVEGWDTALMRVSLLPQQVSSIELLHLFGDVSGMPAVVIGGEQDRVIARRKLESIHQQLPHSSYCLLSFCGHLAHEECPSELLMLLETLVAQAVKSSPTVNERIVSSLGGNAAGQHEGDMMPT